MTEALKKTLIFNGAIIFFYSMLVGFPYALVVARDASDDAIRDWSVAHDATTVGAIVLFILGVMLTKLLLSEKQYKILSWSFIISFYCFSVSTTLEALVTDETYSLSDPQAATVIIMLFSTIATITALIGGVLLLIGAYNALTSNGSGSGS